MLLAEDINPFQEIVDKLLHDTSNESLNVMFTFKHIYPSLWEIVLLKDKLGKQCPLVAM